MIVDTRPSVIHRPWFRARSFSLGLRIMIDAPVRDPKPGERVIGRFILPPFQRPSVWTREQETRLIESIWNRLPVGAYVVNSTLADSPCDGWLLDGQQRCTAIIGYMRSQFPVFGYRFRELPAVDQREFNYGIPMACLETNLEDEAACRDVYERLAYGGTSHDR